MSAHAPTYSFTIYTLTPDVGHTFNLGLVGDGSGRWYVEHTARDDRDGLTFPPFEDEERAVAHAVDRLLNILDVPGPKVISGDWDRFLCENISVGIEAVEIPRVDKGVIVGPSEVLTRFATLDVAIAINAPSFLFIKHRRVEASSSQTEVRLPTIFTREPK